MDPSVQKEWLETDGDGGFASGTTAGIRTRRYHALLLVATTPPTGRMVLVNGFDAWVTTPAGTFPISSQAYSPDVVHPDGARRIASFEADPWPRWNFRLEDGTMLEHEIFVVAGPAWEAVAAGGIASAGASTNAGPRGASVIAWRLSKPAPGVTLAVRPFLSGRDQHALHRENANFRFDAAVSKETVQWQPYPDLPGIVAKTNGVYTHRPDWYRNFRHDQERARGQDFMEDLASPGIFTWDLSVGDAVWILRSEESRIDSPHAGESAVTAVTRWRAAEEQRRNGQEASIAGQGAPRSTGVRKSDAGAKPGTAHEGRHAPTKTASGARSRLLRSASAYLVQRGSGKTVIAGYPWFTDWGRDTFIALRGLCLATGRLRDGRDILVRWTAAVSKGMLPNRFPEAGESAEYNAVDASLWFIVAVHDFLVAARSAGWPVAAPDRSALLTAIDAILDGYVNGTRYNIRCDVDGLLAAGEPGVQLTWMDAKVGDRVITPRIGKPVEVQALWLNALKIGEALTEDRAPAPAPAQAQAQAQAQAKPQPRTRAAILESGLQAFRERFWNDTGGCLYDVVDVDHRAGAVDASFRPNQIFAVGGLPFPLLRPERARAMVDAVQAHLLTPMGLRSLAPDDPRYFAHYRGDVSERDAAHHQGTAWPWLMGPFVEAWVRVRGGSAAAKREARERFLAPLLEHLDEAGLGHVSEIADGDPPHTPRGCPFQAWSVGEALRLDRSVLAQ